MKFIAFSFLLLFTTIITAQSINQFDAEGKRDGIWKKTFDNTKVLRYEGVFIHGKEVGLFKFYKNINGKAVLAATRQFNESNTIADAKFYTSKGKLISEGQMDGKIYIGTWKYYQKKSDTLLILEHYDNFGKLDGERLVYYKNGQIAEKQFYKSGKLEGESFLYSEENKVLKSFVYVNGELHGISKYYSPDGGLLVEGNYKRGKKDGVWKYYENGVLKEEKDFTYKPKYKKKTP
ncbi:toxin-antitoxin system YwqK family antitoxin [Thalassobellus citreus]|uniref:toxin-antitoxin system YwqK family antitoxin n=1 Tax=Thalassobellus citreus TaxID=3367752 RepID=UPI0037AFAE55